MIDKLIRKSIQQLTPYTTARDAFKGQAQLFLDANESPYPSPYNRYPDPQQEQLKARIAELKKVKTTQLFFGNGSDEAIDLVVRIFCEPNVDSILIVEPTYGMYAVCAQINGVAVLHSTLDENFDLDIDSLLQTVTLTTKVIFLCSPNNPSGNLLNREKVEHLIRTFPGIVVIDEAYIDFSDDPGFTLSLGNYSNLVILQTLSKAWGLAGLRLGICMASEEIIRALNKVKYPYNVSALTQQFAIEILHNDLQQKRQVSEIKTERERLRSALTTLKIVKQVYPSQANFLLVRMENAKATYQALLDNGIIVRDRSSSLHCENCLRITVGTPQENRQLIDTLRKI